jgi:hypothetical protein
MEVGGKVGSELVKGSRVRALTIPHLSNQLIVVRSFEGRCSDRELVQNGAEPVDVRSLGRPLASDHFRREIGDGPS